MTASQRAIALVIACAGACASAPNTAPAAGPASPAQRTITGRVVGHDGAPLALAEVHCEKRSVTADRDGRFRIAVPAVGIARIDLSGVDHATTTVPITDPGPLELDVALGTPAHEEPVASASLLTFSLEAKTGELRRARPFKMQRQDDGTFLATVEHDGPELFYEVVTEAGSHTFNGTQSDAFRYDGSDYASRVAVHGGKVEVRFDPRRLPPAGREPRVTFRAASRAQVEIARLHREANALRDAAFRSAAVPADTARASAMQQQRATERDPIVRQALLAAFFVAPPSGGWSTPERAALAERAIAEIPVDSALWTVWPDALPALPRAGGSDAVYDYVMRAAQRFADRERAVEALARIGFGAMDGVHDAHARRVYDTLRTRYADLWRRPNTLAAGFVTEADPDRRIQAGRPAPAFDVAALDDPAARLTLESLRGKVVLVDFWATWCTPCVNEIPAMRAAYEAFHARGFEIVSIDTSEPVDTVTTFRKQTAMPWPHAVVASSDPIVAAFEVMGLPSPVLIDRNGKIVATRWEARGDKLAGAIERALQAP